ncbi:hypothetical protein E2C01_052317 [Portunus trituberculatus]|uniref:Uncharacterized protein n=1 Tax=Portunus trituberculatus TaxID=210409 RepID=A0A5B7GL86_PORTR|nr:hypothetical protein [Portunus trituberculatus]
MTTTTNTTDTSVALTAAAAAAGAAGPPWCYPPHGTSLEECITLAQGQVSAGLGIGVGKEG